MYMKGNVLYVEDEEFFAKTISNKLQEDDIAVDIASDGEQGIAKLAEKEYDAILLDLMLPKVSGFDLLKKIPSLSKNKTTPIVILSNLSSDADKEKANDLGAHSFYVKINSTPNEILSVVQAIIDTRKNA